METQILELLKNARTHENLSVPELIEAAIKNGEGILAKSGALVVETGKYTGRSPDDRFIVDEPSVHDNVDWSSVNKPVSQEIFNNLLNKLADYFKGKEAYIFNGFSGHDPAYRIPVRFINEFASQNLFAQQVFVPRTDSVKYDNEFTVICAPGLKTDPAVDGTNSEAFVILSFERRMVIIGGSQYAGEIKKSMFSVMNYLLPEKGVLPMHCSANMADNGEVALFFGLSGTGKTTLSADGTRRLIGDDEHGWTDSGVFNFEGGCYAKCINLSQEKEPQIWGALKFGSLLENVVIDKNRNLDFDSDSLTENSRGSYPLGYIDNSVIPSLGGHPNTIIFLTADAFGVMPPLAKLDSNQSGYHFLSGYTSKLAGTERGITEPQAAFVPCFGAPFLPRSPKVYAELLKQKINTHNVDVYLVNTGWTGGPYGVGSRISIKNTRALVNAALNGTLKTVGYHKDPFFGLNIPDSCPGVPSELLDPRNTWDDKAAYDASATKLAAMFDANFKKFE